MNIDQTLLEEISKVVIKEDNNFEDLQNKLQSAYKELFPYGEIIFRKQSLGGKGFIITLTMLSKEDWPNKIIQNDPIFTNIFINEIGNDQLEAELTHGGRLMLQPEEHQRMYAMVPFKVPFRKTKGSEDKILKTLNQYFMKMRQAVDNNAEKIYGRDRIDDKYFE